jgi:hypothetical protein
MVKHWMQQTCYESTERTPNKSLPRLLRCLVYMKTKKEKPIRHAARSLDYHMRTSVEHDQTMSAKVPLFALFICPGSVGTTLILNRS